MTAPPTLRPRLLVVAGPNGAGKTTITERGLAHEWFHDWNDAATVLRAAQLATERREACLREGWRAPRGPKSTRLEWLAECFKAGTRLSIAGARSIANAASVAAEVDRFYVYDNSVDDRDAQTRVACRRRPCG